MGQYVKKVVKSEKWVLEGESVAVETEILRLILENKQPMKVLALLDAMVEDHLPPYEYRQVQDALFLLIENGELEMTPERTVIINNL